VEIATAQLWRRYLSDDSLEPPVWVLEDKLDRLDALGGAAAGRTATMDKLIELCSQEWV